MTRIATIIATGQYIPEHCITNAQLAAHFTALGKPEVIGKFETATGIRQRYYAPDDWATSDLALHASRQALQRAGRDPEDVDLIILASDSLDYMTPATSAVLQHKLGATGAGTFDVVCACAGFPTALAAAAGMIATNHGINTVLVVAAYMMRKLADPDDPTIFFYGDGAGAAVLESSDKPGFIGAVTHADGGYADVWGIFSGGTAEPATIESVTAGRTQVRMVKRLPPEINEQGWPALFQRLADENDFTVNDVGHVIFTQVRKDTVELVAEKIGLPLDKAHTIMEMQGYTGAACIPMALDDAIQHGKIGSGDLVVLIGSGVGYNQAAVAVRMP